jgi:hypothetical protein
MIFPSHQSTTQQSIIGADAEEEGNNQLSRRLKDNNEEV